MRADPIIRSALAIGAATGVYAVSYGVLAVGAGLSVAQTCAVSLLVFTGASQFALVGVLGAGGSVLAAVGPALLLAARNLIYGLSMAPLLRGPFAARAWQSQLVIDESTAMARAQPDPRAARRAFIVTGSCVFVCWNIGTLAGGLLGDSVGDPKALGLDAMFPAAFLALLVPQLGTRQARIAAVCGALVAIALVPLTPVGLPVVASIVGMVPAARSLRATQRQEAPA